MDIKLKFHSRLKLMVVALSVIVALLILFNGDSHTVETHSITNELSEHANNKSNHSYLSIYTESLDRLNTTNIYMFRRENNYHLEKDTIVLLPQSDSNSSPKIRRDIKIPDRRKIKLGVEAKNAALLTETPVRWQRKDCAKSKIEFTAVKSNSDLEDKSEKIEREFIVDNTLEKMEIDLSRLKNHDVILEVSLGEYSACGSKINEAALIESFYIQSSESKISELL